jgi:hypothetical protein
MTGSGPSPAQANLLTLAEAGRILGATAMTVHRMAAEGLLERADERPLKNRQITRASVDQVATEWSRRISTGAAATMLGVGQDKFRELVRTGLLTRHRYSPHPIAIDQVQLLINAGALIDPAHRGRIPAREAAQQLGLSPSTIARRARTGRLPAMRDQHGQWWVKPEHIEIQARSAAAVLQRRRLE